MKCIKCKSEIDDDSYYCDQCGVEIKKCSVCHEPGISKRCTKCGNVMVPAKELTNGVSVTTESPNSDTHQTDNSQNTIIDSSADKTIRSGGSSDYIENSNNEDKRTLTLINNVLNIHLKGEHDAILGRRKGQYSNILGQYGQVSGSHARLTYTPSQGWYITDLGSTNGTKYNKAPITPNVPQRLENNSSVQIANIEFYVEIK
jgi:pSer/pThr/pTyr-binding forkhead associated (FHA) protein/predicted RNA-binding Zn-ribbon protein involved in translation (DUF1610 family)